MESSEACLWAELSSDEDEQENEEQQVEEGPGHKKSSHYVENTEKYQQKGSYSHRKQPEKREFNIDQRKIIKFYNYSLDNEKLKTFIKEQQNELILYIFGMHHSVRKEDLLDIYANYNLKFLKWLEKGTFLLEFHKKEDAINFINSDKKMVKGYPVKISHCKAFQNNQNLIVLKKIQNEGNYQPQKPKFDNKRSGNYKQYQNSHQSGYNRKCLLGYFINFKLEQQQYQNDNQFNQLKEQNEENKQEEEKKIYKPIKFINRRKEKEEQEQKEAQQNLKTVENNEVKNDEIKNKQEEKELKVKYSFNHQFPTQKEEKVEKKEQKQEEKKEEKKEIPVEIPTEKTEIVNNSGEPKKQDQHENSQNKKEGKRRNPQQQKKKSGKHYQQVYVPKGQANEKPKQESQPKKQQPNFYSNNLFDALN